MRGEGFYKLLMGEGAGERAKVSERNRGRVMVTFIPSRDHQKRASWILLTSYLPCRGGDGELPLSLTPNSLPLSRSTRDTETDALLIMYGQDISHP